MLLKFSLWEVVVLLSGLILDNFYFRGCGHLERHYFGQFLLWEGVVVLKELILDNFHIVRVWYSWRTHFGQFVLWEGVVVLKELIFDNRLLWLAKSQPIELQTVMCLCVSLDHHTYQSFWLNLAMANSANVIRLHHHCQFWHHCLLCTTVLIS